MDLYPWAVRFPSLIHGDWSFCAILTTAGSVFSLFFPFKIHRYTCETVLSPRETFEQDRGSQRMQTPGQASQTPLTSPMQQKLSPSTAQTTWGPP